MLSSKKRLALILTVIILSFIVIVVKSKYSYLFKAKPQPLFPKIDKSNINKITIYKQNNKKIVEKENDHWFVLDKNNKFPGDLVKIESLIDSVLSLERTTIVSNNKNKHESLGIGKDYIELNDKEGKYTLFIANSNTQSKEYYRYDNENSVYSTSSLADLFNINDYRDLKIGLINDESSVINIFIKTPIETFNITKQKDNWYLDGKKIDKQKIDFFVNDLKTLQSDDINTESSLDTSLTPYFQIQVQEGKNKKTLDFYKLSDTEDNNLVKTSYNPYEYKINSTQLEILNKNKEYFLKND